MSDADIRIDLHETDPASLAEAIGHQLVDDPTWKRDGILEHQVSTREDVQFCFRHDPDDDLPRTALCLAGTEETLTVATVVPIDRGIELTDAQYTAIVRQFHEQVLTAATTELDVEIKLLV